MFVLLMLKAFLWFLTVLELYAEHLKLNFNRGYQVFGFDFPAGQFLIVCFVCWQHLRCQPHGASFSWGRSNQIQQMQRRMFAKEGESLLQDPP
jgi:hypothetical protein